MQEPAANVLVFGSQALNFNATSLKNLRDKLLSDPMNEWALSALSTLPETVASLAAEIPRLQPLANSETLKLLVKAVHGGTIPSTLFPLPNALLSPLVVTSQLVDYTAYLKTLSPDLDDVDRIPLSRGADAEILGLCTGFLSASAAAASATLGELQRQGSVSVQLAMLSGALVDAEDDGRETGQQSVSLSTSWAAASFADIEATMADYTDVCHGELNSDKTYSC